MSFEAPIVPAPRGGAYVEVPPHIVDALGGKGRIAVNASFDGIAYRGSIVSMGGQRILGIQKAMRSELGRSPGDPVKVSVEVDRAVRSVTVPDDLAAALAEAGQSDVLNSLSYSHQREYVRWVEEAKQPATRARRITQSIHRLGPDTVNP
jgi:hypothetical protein